MNDRPTLTARLSSPRATLTEKVIGLAGSCSAIALLISKVAGG